MINSPASMFEPVMFGDLGKSTQDWLQAPGATAAEIAGRDWSRTALGPRESWPVALRTSLNLIMNSGQPMFLAWGNDLLSFYNDAYAPIVDDKPGRIGRPLAELFPEAIAQVRPFFDQALLGKVTYRENICIPIERQGKVQPAWWRASYSPIHDEHGSICGVFVPVHEITARLQAEQKLRASDETLQIISDIVPSLLWRANHEGEIIWKNRRLMDFASGIDPRDLVHPEDVASMELEWARSRREGSMFRHYHRLRTVDGEYRWHLATSEPRFNATGGILEWFGVASDVHDLRVMADELASTSLLFRKFGDTSSDVLWIFNVETQRFEYVSAAFQRIWGVLPDQEVTWDLWLSTIFPDDRQHLKSTLERLLQGETLVERYRILRPDGTVRWIRETMFPILGTHGVIERVGGIAQDITRDNGHTVHLVAGAGQNRNAVSQRLQDTGYEVRLFDTPDAFLRASRALVPGCVVYLDPEDEPEADRLVAGLKNQSQTLPLVLVCKPVSAARAIWLMKQGVSDIILPDDTEDRLQQAVCLALTGMKGSERKGDAVQCAKEQLQQLTERESEVLEGLGNGATNKVLARELGISPRTIETYRVRILEKLGVGTLPEAVKIAALAGL